MRRPGRRVYLLPPRPRRRDWLSAGASGGLLLGVAELAVAWSTGVALPPPLAALVVAAEAGVAALAAGAVGIALRACQIRVSHAALVGTVAGLLLGVAAAAPLWGWLSAGRLPGPFQGVALAGGLGLAVFTALLSTRLADRVERSGIPVSRPLVWGAIALALASAERAFSGDATAGWAPLTGLLLACALVLVVSFEWARRRGGRTVVGHGRVLTLASLAALVAAFWPWLLPWVLYDDALPEVGSGPPNILVVAVDSPVFAGTSGTPDRTNDASPEAELLAWGAIVYERVLAEGPAGAEALVALPDGGRVAQRLRERGYATAALVGDPEPSWDIGVAELDARPGGRRLLAESASWTAGAPILLGPASGVLALLGLDLERRSPAQLGREAERWLLRWRTTRAPAPFFLFVDLRIAGTRYGSAAGTAGAVRRILRQLEQLMVAEATLVLVARERREAIERPMGRPALRVLARPPAGWLPFPPGFRAERQIPSGEFAVSLLRGSLGEGGGPLALPGLPPADLAAPETEAPIDRPYSPPSPPPSRTGSGGTSAS